MKFPSSLALLSLLLGTASAFSAENDLGGRYTHDFTEPSAEPVWQVQRVGTGYGIEYLSNGEREPAWRLDRDGRAAFWDRMMWPAATAQGAECVSWGEAPLSLADLLELPDDEAASAVKPASSPAQTPGAGVLCRVEPGTRAQISWLRDNHSDYFFYDPIIGVMEVRRLPDLMAPSPPGAAP